MATKKKIVRKPKRKKRPAKKPPPKQIERDMSIYSGSKARTALITSAGPEETPGTAWLRHLACLRYTTSQDGISIPKLSKLEPFNFVSLDTLYRWSAEDGWVESRREYHQGIKNRVESAIGDTMVKTRVAQLKQMTGMFEDACNKLDSVDARVGTYEGLLMVIIRMADQLDKMREKISKELIPAGFGSTSDNRPLKASLSEEEAREASKAVIKMRREQMRKRLESGVEEDGS